MKRYLALALVGLFGCDPEVPPLEDPTCWGNVVAPGAPRPAQCDEQRCFEKTTAIEIDSWGGAMGQFTCTYCSDLPPESVSADDYVRTKEVQFNTEGFRLKLRFDNRAMQDPTLEKLQQYAVEASFSYETPQGTLGGSWLPFEVVSYADNRMRVRLQAEDSGMQYQVATTPLTGCLPPGPCIIICSYGVDPQYGGSGEPVHFDVDVMAPLVITPYQ